MQERPESEPEDADDHQQEEKTDNTARLIANVLQMHAEQRQRQQHLPAVYTRQAARSSISRRAEAPPRPSDQGEARQATTSPISESAPQVTDTAPFRTLAPDFTVTGSSLTGGFAGMSPSTRDIEALLRLQLQSHVHSRNVVARSLPAVFPARLPNLGVQRSHAEQRVEAASFPGTLGLSTDQILRLLGQHVSGESVQQQQQQQQQQLYDNAGAIELLQNALFSNSARQPVPSFFAPHMPTGSSVLGSVSIQTDQASRLLVAPLLGERSSPAATRTSTSSSNPIQEQQAYEPQHASNLTTMSTGEERSADSPARRKRGASEDRAESVNKGDEPAKRKKRPYHHESFPVKLHRLLRETEEAGKTDIISFSKDGKEFSVHKPAALESEILPNYFRHNQLSSFRRLLNMYGFLRLQDGAEGGTFRHPSFLKDRPDLCKDLDRVR